MDLVCSNVCSDHTGCLLSDGALIGVGSATFYNPPLHARSGCHRVHGNLEHEQQRVVLRTLRRLQSTSCDNATRLAAYWNAGFAASFHYLVLQLKQNLRRGGGSLVFGHGVFASGNRWRAVDGRHFLYGACASGGLECVFNLSRISACAAHTRVRAAVRHLQHDLPRHHAADVTFVSPLDWQLYYPSRRIDDAPEWSPTHSLGTLWLISTLSGFLFQLNDHMRDEVDQRRSLIGLARPSVSSSTSAPRPSAPRFLGVQIRRGDACPLKNTSARSAVSAQGTQGLPTLTRECAPTARYVAPILRLASTHKLNTVLLATDDMNATAELTAALASTPHPMRVISQGASALRSNDPRESTKRIERRLAGLKRSSRTLHAATVEVLTDIDTLADADAFVGPMTSQVMRLAFELSLFRKGRVVPFESLDIGWCWGGYAAVPVTHRDGGKWTLTC